MTERDHREPPAVTASDASRAPTVAPDRARADRGDSAHAEAPPLLQPGQDFGPYSIVRLLGRGGMGEVYEAEEVDSGRRVALKLLNRPLSTRAERDRFMREGRLAAGVSHPHCVYVFGTDEIAGLPTISMELAAGGTLKDVVRSRGPLPFREAVDAVLQIISGLEAAAAAGVLHRDIKPANCFIDEDGSVKVGDFGLSTSTLAQDETHLTMAGTIMGTPAFASPEQMKADELDVRSDIYSVGATLYFLLTGRAPFEEANVVRLVAMVMQDTPPAPRELGKGIPRGLSAVVMKALAKRPADRFDDYASLRAALEPFGSAAPAPAPVGFRLLAYLVDYLAIGVLNVLLVSPFAVIRTSVKTDFGAIVMGEGLSFAQVAVPLVFWAFYWILLEGLTGASLGKRLFGLRVAGAGGEPAGFGPVLLRTAVFMALPSITALAWLVPSLAGGFLETVQQSGPIGLAMWLGPLLIVFVTARPRNGFAGLHELASGTRVLAVRSVERVAALGPSTAEPASVGPARIGPYTVADEEARQAGAAVLRGWDVRLRRPVWLHLVEPGFALPAWRRDLARPARPRWLAGRREKTSSWDAYEALEGRSFRATVGVPQPWRRVRGWLVDLAREVEAGLADGSLPALSLDRLWVGNNGRVQLLDWPVPGEPAGDLPDEDRAAAPDPHAAARFLRLVATSGLGANAILPLRAARLIEDLSAGRAGLGEGLGAAVSEAAVGPAEVTPGRRVLHLAFAGIPPLLVVLLSWLMLSTILPQLFSADQQSTIGYVRSLEELARLDKKPDSAEVRALREAWEIDIAARFPQLVSAAGISTRLHRSLPSELQAIVARIRANHSNPSPEQARRAREVVAPLLQMDTDERRRIESGLRAGLPTAALLLWAMFGGAALMAAIAARGGAVLRLLGIAVVDASGREAARWRAGFRALVAWLPIFASAAARFWGDAPVVNGIVWPSLAVFAAGALYAVFSPSRGLPDRIAGTWLVPR